MNDEDKAGMWEFKITIASHGANRQDAWEEAVNSLAMDPGAPEDEESKFLEEDHVCDDDCRSNGCTSEAEDI